MTNYRGVSYTNIYQKVCSLAFQFIKELQKGVWHGLIHSTHLFCDLETCSNSRSRCMKLALKDDGSLDHENGEVNPDIFKICSMHHTLPYSKRLAKK